MTRMFLIALLGSSALVSASALAQTPPATAATSNETPAQADPNADAPVAPEPVPTAEESASQTQFLQAQVDALQAQLDALKKQMGVVTPGWKGAPQFSSDNGFTFKPKGFAQFDAGYVGTPGPKLSGTAGGLDYNNLGFGARARRLVIGAEGALPGGFGYKFELDLAQGTVSYEDIVLTYQHAGSPFQLTVGNFYPLSSLDTMTSSRLTSFLERASFTQAFGYNRRLGAAIGLADPADRYTLTAGLWNQEINNANPGTSRTGWQASVRGTWSPQFGSTRLHLGANFQHRVNQRDVQNRTYSSAPLTQITNQSFVSTGSIAEKGDDIAGLELGAIHGPFHFAGEAQKVWVDGYRTGTVFTANNGVSGGTFYAGDPTFLTGYAEVGFYLTGETRGYKGGKWDRTKVLHPFDQGGMGAFQVNARFDYLDLEDRVATGTTFTAPNFVNGGKQLGYELSLIWNPMDYIRFMAQFGHAHVEGGPRAATVVPTSTDPIVNRAFNVNSFAMRAQVEF